MVYASKTNQFPQNEVLMLQEATAAILIASLLPLDPVIALRAIAEVMLNNDNEKLQLLLASQEFTNHWRNFASGMFVDSRDHEYARQLEEKLKEME